MQIYFYKFNPKINETNLNFLASYLPSSRKQKYCQLTNKILKQFVVVEYFIIKKAIAFKGLPDFLYNKFGKPYIKNQKNFSISHSGTLLAIAISNQEIGIDVEHVITYSNLLAKRICSAQEYKKIIKAKNKNITLTKLWTKKESFIKLNGSSIFCGMKNCEYNDCNFKYLTHKNFIVCICTKK